MDPDSRRLRVTVTDGQGRQVRSGALARWLEDVAPARIHGELTIALVTDRHIQDLNRRFRRKNVPTDVLSFPASIEPEPRTPSGGKYLGDIAIATGVARRQAREAGHSYLAELRTLALHGLLHLLGYDHHRPSDRGRMAKLEVRLRRRGGLREGLIERARGDRTVRPIARGKGSPGSTPRRRRPDRG